MNRKMIRLASRESEAAWQPRGLSRPLPVAAAASSERFARADRPAPRGRIRRPRSSERPCGRTHGHRQRGVKTFAWHVCSFRHFRSLQIPEFGRIEKCLTKSRPSRSYRIGRRRRRFVVDRLIGLSVFPICRRADLATPVSCPLLILCSHRFARRCHCRSRRAARGELGILHGGSEVHEKLGSPAGFGRA